MLASYHINVLMQFPALARSWLMSLLYIFTARQQQRNRDYLHKIIKKRTDQGIGAKHDLYHLVSRQVNIEDATDPKLSQLWSEAAFFYIAGTETSTTTMSALFFYLSRNKECYQRLASEVRTAFTRGSNIKKGPNLVGSPGILWREASAQDAENNSPLVIDGHVVRPGTQVGVSTYAIHHNEEYFPDPFAFKPERWLADEIDSRVLHAFVPFSTGTRSCSGKSMAYLEISLTVANTMWYFNFETPSRSPGGVDGGKSGRLGRRGRSDEFQLYDIFTATHTGPVLSFRPRGAVANEEAGAPAPEWQPSKHEKAIIYTLAFLNLIVALDATIIVTALQAITADIGGTTTQAFWIGTSYLLVNAVTMPLICSISDVIGRPICLTFSIAAFTIGTILCCTAKGIAVMLVGRCIQGVGGGGIHSLSLVVQTDFVPLRFRPQWYGVTLGAWGIGLTVGPLIGGAIAERTTWRWIFYLMFPICGFGLVAVPYLLTLRPKKISAQEKFSRVDWIGGLFFAGSAAVFLMALSWGGTEFPWNSAATIAPLVIGIVGIILAVLYEIYLAPHPFLRKELFQDISSIVTYIAAAFQGYMLNGTLHYCSFYFTSVKKYSTIDSGLALLPDLVAFSVSGIVTGRLVTRFNSFRWAIWLGWLLSCAGTAMFVLAGWGHGAILNAQNFATQAMCRAGDEGAAAAMYIFARQFGMALGVGVGATTFQNAMKRKLRWDGLPTQIADNAEAYVPTLHTLPLDDPVYDAYKFGFQIVFATWLAISVVTLFFCLVFVKHADMNRKLASEHTLDSERMIRHWGKKEAAGGEADK
ncbi:major facilitator superfamily domain-containing protein [Hypoxylon sp. FL1284]|nr:major facilitator superfamily domain-containing protein [Hypoxylon sp. FL1284]